MTEVFKKIQASVFALCAIIALGVALAAGATIASADEPTPGAPGTLDQPYTYTITLSAGGGTIDGQAIKTTSGIANGQQITLDYSGVVPNDSRYYVKGIRLAGRDNSEVVAPTFNVTGDAQYVVAYGLKKDQVAYTINFVDEAGNQLAESATYYGNVGDKPVVAFRYIDNYLPNAYNLTGTLSADEDENVFTFVYRSAPGVTYTTVPGAAAAGGAAAAPGDAAAAVAAAAEAGEIIGDDGNPLAAPEDTIDIDDNDNPLANIAGDPEGQDGALSPAVIAGIVAGVLALFIIAAVLLMRRKRKSEAVQQ